MKELPGMNNQATLIAGKLLFIDGYCLDYWLTGQVLRVDRPLWHTFDLSNKKSTITIRAEVVTLHCYIIPIRE